MKTARQNGLSATKGASRRDWPQPAELSPLRSSSMHAATRSLAEPPVRPVPGWRLPSGQLLVEYALRAGLASSPLLVRLPLLGGGSAANGQAVSAGEPVMPNSLASLAKKLGVKSAVGANVVAVKPGRGGRS